MLKIVKNPRLYIRNISVSSVHCRDHPEIDPDPVIERKHELAIQEIERKIEADKKKLKWRTPIAENPNFWSSKLKLFADMESSNADLVEKVQQPLDLSIGGIRAWYNRKREARNVLLQTFLPDRHRILGNDLATAHFVVHRGGLVKFCGQEEWVKKDKNDNYKLPDKFVPNLFLEKVDCSNMRVYYEGLQNFENLSHLTYLSFKNNDVFNDWSLDRVSSNEYHSLEVLDISGTVVTERGLTCLYRIPSLKELLINDYEKDVSWKLTCAMLEEINPKLVIKLVPKTTDSRPRDLFI